MDEIRAESERLIASFVQKNEPPPGLIRLWAPHPYGQVQGWSGKTYDLRDHWVEVELNDAAPLLRAGFKREGDERPEAA